MGAMKREAERLAEIIIYGSAETIAREFQKVIDNGGGAQWIAGAVEMSRYMSPLCECGADYAADLETRHPQIREQVNKESATA
jgi:hypothetical protein